MIQMTNLERAKDFANRLISGQKLANKEQVQAAQRFLDDLEDERWEYRAKQADFVINIIEKTMVHVQGEDRDGKPYKDTAVKLQDWQIFVIVNLFGFFIRDTNIRRFNEALIFLPRKQGKTAFTAALTWAKNILDRKSGSKTYIVANSLKQTQESFFLWSTTPNVSKTIWISYAFAIITKSIPLKRIFQMEHSKFLRLLTTKIN